MHVAVITDSGTSPCFARRPLACSRLISRAYRASKRVLFVFGRHNETPSSDCLSNHATRSFAYLRVCVHYISVCVHYISVSK